MSKPQNPLDFYRSHSYHHILIASNSTKVLDAMSAPEFQFSKLTRSNVGRTSEDIEVKQLSNLGQYVVIFNGMQDTDFFIRDMNWESVMVPRFGTTDNYTTMGMEGQMTIVEPKGARFFRYLNDVFDKLQCDPVGITFILKTVFVGHQDGDLNVAESSSIPQQIANVKPMGFMLYDIQSNFDEAGSEYNLAFIGSINGAAKLPQITNVVDAGMQSVAAFDSSGDSASPDTLLNVMERFEKLINSKYDNFFETFIAERSNGDRCNRRVEYQIVLDKVYEDASYIIDDLNERVGENVNEGVIAFGPKMNIEQCLNKIMKSSSRVLKDATDAVDGQGKKRKYIFKIHSVIQSTVDGESAGVFKIVYVIRQYEVKVANKADVIGRASDDLIEPGNVLEMDYVFTGNNTDVLEFNMKMETGLLFLMTLQPSSNLTNSSTTMSNKNPDNKKLTPGNNRNASYSKRCNTPLFPPQTPADQEVLHSNNAMDKTNFRTLLNKHAMLSALEATVKIRGNPHLLNDLLITSNDMITQTSNIDPESSIMGDWTRTPGLIKLNIRMPSDPDDMDNLAFSEPFWYQGHYQVLSVNNIFDNGEFTQEIEMFAMPQEDEVPVLQSTQTPDAKQTQEINSSEQIAREKN